MKKLNQILRNGNCTCLIGNYFWLSCFFQSGEGIHLVECVSITYYGEKALDYLGICLKLLVCHTSLSWLLCNRWLFGVLAMMSSDVLTVLSKQPRRNSSKIQFAKSHFMHLKFWTPLPAINSNWKRTNYLATTEVNNTWQ